MTWSSPHRSLVGLAAVVVALAIGASPEGVWTKRLRPRGPMAGGATVHPANPLVFSGPPEGADALARSRVDIVSLANNPSWDYGWDGLRQTLENLDRVGIRAVGAGRTRDEAERFAVVEAKGFRVAFFAVTDIFNQSDSRPARDHVAAADADGLADRVSRLRRRRRRVHRSPPARRPGHRDPALGFIAKLVLSTRARPELSVCPHRMFGLVPIPSAADEVGRVTEERFRHRLSSTSLAHGGVELGDFDASGCASVRPPAQSREPLAGQKAVSSISRHP